MAEKILGSSVTEDGEPHGGQQSPETLLARLDGLPKGSGELDRLIGAWCQNIPLRMAGWGTRYTLDTDDALRLVPKGWWAEIFARPDQPSCILWEFSMPCRRLPAERPYVIAAGTVPLAICIAAPMAHRLPSPAATPIRRDAGSVTDETETTTRTPVVTDEPEG